MADTAANRAPVFIVGMNGSGTTMLLDSLNSHPRIYGFPLETKILPHYLKRLDRYGDLSDDKRFLKLWQDIRHITFFKMANGGMSPPLPEDWAEHERSLAAILDAIFRYFAEREGKARWCEKSPRYALYIDKFAAIFPEARFIHLIRDGRDCAASFHRRWGYTPADTMRRWKHVVRRCRERGRALGDRYMELRYEELTEQPSSSMRHVCAFLDEAYVGDVLETERTRNNRMKRLSQQIVPNNRKWRTYFLPDELRSLERIGGKLLAELSYETRDPTGDHDPNVVQICYWTSKDNLRRTLDTMAQFMAASDRRRQRLILERLLTNVRHKLHVRSS